MPPLPPAAHAQRGCAAAAANAAPAAGAGAEQAGERAADGGGSGGRLRRWLQRVRRRRQVSALLSRQAGKAAPAGETLQTVILQNKAPHWNEGLRCWCLNFRGRVKLASVKNFQVWRHAGDLGRAGGAPAVAGAGGKKGARGGSFKANPALTQPSHRVSILLPLSPSLSAPCCRLNMPCRAAPHCLTLAPCPPLHPGAAGACRRPL